MMIWGNCCYSIFQALRGVFLGIFQWLLIGRNLFQLGNQGWLYSSLVVVSSQEKWIPFVFYGALLCWEGMTMLVINQDLLRFRYG